MTATSVISTMTKNAPAAPELSFRAIMERYRDLEETLVTKPQDARDRKEPAIVSTSAIIAATPAHSPAVQQIQLPAPASPASVTSPSTVTNGHVNPAETKHNAAVHVRTNSLAPVTSPSTNGNICPVATKHNAAVDVHTNGTSTQVSDIRQLSLAERKKLEFGPRVYIYVGQEHVAVVPLPLFLAVSSKLRAEHENDPEISMYKYHLREGIGANSVKAIVTWLKEVVGSLDPKTVEIKKSGNIKSDLIICRAAVALKLDEVYYAHIFKTYLNRFEKMIVKDLKAKGYVDMAVVDELATGPGDAMLRCVAKTLARLRVHDKVNTSKELKKFLAGCKHLKAIVEEEETKLRNCN